MNEQTRFYYNYRLENDSQMALLKEEEPIIKDTYSAHASGVRRSRVLQDRAENPCNHNDNTVQSVH